MLMVKGSDFTPAPDGVHPAVCVDVVDLGMVDGMYGTKHKIKVVWEIDALMDDGRRFIVQKRYGASLHEKSTLHKDLKSWRGKPFTPDELRGFDLDKIAGVPCQVVVTQSEKDGQVYADVTTVIKAAAVRLQPSGAYQRVKDRPPEQQKPVNRFASNGANGNHRQPAQQQEEEEAEIPF